jgi:hypothetical protein
MRTRRTAVLALAASAALAIGVTAAWAGFPNMRIADSTFTEGTVTKGGGKTTTSSRTLAAVAPSAAQTYAPATIYVHFRATGVSGSPTFTPNATGLQEWACANSGGGWPADPKKFVGPATVSGSQLTLAADRNGRLIYTADGLAITFAPPTGFACPTGQTALLVGLDLTRLWITVSLGGETQDTEVAYPTSAGWVGNVYTRAGYPG